MAGPLSILSEVFEWRAGDWAEVRPLDEILASLDGEGCLESLPFMPEMIPYCGQFLRVVKVAHKTCDPTGSTDLRRMKNAVHLETRCDGSHHGGCQAGCLLFWKTAWLKKPGSHQANALRPVCDQAALERATRVGNEDEAVYRCQATEIVRATARLPSTQPMQYVRDIVSRNVTLAEFLWHAPAIYLKGVKNRLARLVGKSASEGRRVAQRAPLHLRPGEFVQIRPEEEIPETLDRENRNLGLHFESDMRLYCGEVRRVLGRVERVIDERNGKMRRIHRDCIVLEGVTCRGLSSRHRLFCPRGAYAFWREAWLERTETENAAVADKQTAS
jgi:hypothetical protein